MQQNKICFNVPENSMLSYRENLET